jgi:hypothetical protein
MAKAIFMPLIITPSASLCSLPRRGKAFGEKKLISLRQEARENIPKIEFHMPFVTKGLGIAGNYDEWIINCVAFA